MKEGRPLTLFYVTKTHAYLLTDLENSLKVVSSYLCHMSGHKRVKPPLLRIMSHIRKWSHHHQICLPHYTMLFTPHQHISLQLNWCRHCFYSDFHYQGT